MNIFEALRLAIRSEVGAQKMYARLTEETSDVEAKALFSYLAEYELTHQRFLEAERNALTATQTDAQGRPSHWLKLLTEELRRTAGKTGETPDADLEQMKVDLSAARSIAEILKTANQELSQKQARYEQELSIAADIQAKLLPQEFPQNMGLQVAASSIMARSVGGDYYDFIINGQGQLAMVVADSMGKGMPAALLMTTIRSIWRSYSVMDSRTPGQIMDMTNRFLYPDLSATESFVTMFSAIYDPETSIFRYSNAGHNPPVFRSAEAPECKSLDVGGIPVGIFPDSSFSSDEFPMREGGIVVIYTDGVVEARDKHDNLFGYDKLCDLVDQHYRLDAQNVKNIILSEVDSHTGGSEQADDITIVVLKKRA